MELGRHAFKGEVTGIPHQYEGKHFYGVAFVPLGDRDRCKPEYVEDYEERDSDANIWRI